MGESGCDLWPTLPLELLDSSELQPQRAFVPAEAAASAGSSKLHGWSKCVLSDGSYAICRLSSRAGSEACCFLDNVVTSSPHFSASNKRLSHMAALTAVSRPQKVACVVTITVELLRRPQISATDLREEVHICLRHLTLVEGCFVRHKRLQQLGIAHVEIFEVPGLAEHECFELTRDISLLLVDVRLAAAKELPSSLHYIPYGFERPMRTLGDLLLASQSPSLSANALLVGAVGSGKSSLLSEFVRRHSCNCFHITAAQVLRAHPGETEAELRQLFEAAHTFSDRFQPLLPIVILLEDLELLCPALKADGKNASQALRIATQLYQLVDGLQQRRRRILCLASSSAPEALHEHARRAGRFSQQISIEMPTAQQRRQLFAAFWLAQHPQQPLAEQLLQQLAQQTQGYVVADLALLLRRVDNQLLLQPGADLPTLLREALRQCQPSASRSADVRVLKMEQLEQLDKSGFEAIGGMAALKRTLQVSVLAGLRQSAAFARFGLSLPRGVLLYGPPGCAKTTLAKCLAQEAHMTLIATSAAEVYSPYVGCAERFITRIFDTARKNAPCLIFLDEIDSLVGRRTVSSGGGSGDVQLRILSTLLTEMDGIVSGNGQQHILVVAASNRPEMIDDALMRPGRFDKLIHVPAPDLESRLALLRLHAQRMPFAASVPLEEIAERTERYSGADLCNLCNEAAIEAFQRDFDASTIELQDFEQVLSRQKSSLTQSQIDGYYKFAYRFL